MRNPYEAPRAKIPTDLATRTRWRWLTIPMALPFLLLGAVLLAMMYLVMDEGGWRPPASLPLFAFGVVFGVACLCTGAALLLRSRWASWGLIALCVASLVTTLVRPKAFPLSVASIYITVCIAFWLGSLWLRRKGALR
jgi:hypothetical protein